jgi:hypothetical protein
MTLGTLAFPIPPHLVLRAAIDSSAHIVSARDVVMTIDQNAYSLRDAIFASDHTHLFDETLVRRRAADVLRPWAEALNQAMMPFKLTVFSFTAKGPSERPTAPDVCTVAQIAAQEMFRAIQREILDRDPPIPVGATANLAIMRDMTTVISIARESGAAVAQRFVISNEPVKTFHQKASDWFSGCREFSLRGFFPWPSAHDRLALQKEIPDYGSTGR